MRTKAWAIAVLLVLFASACREDQAATLPSPSPTETSSPSPAAPVRDTFTLEGEVVEAWGTAVASAAPATGSTASPGPSPTATSTPAAGSAASPSPGTGSSPDQTDGTAANGPGAGAVTVRLTSYFSDTGCTFSADDLVVIRFTSVTTVEPPEVADDEFFPNNLEEVRATISGHLLGSGPNCLPIADSITLLEEASPTASPAAGQTSGRARARTSRPATPRRTPSPTPLNGATGTEAEPGNSNTGMSSITGPNNRNNNPDRSQPDPDEDNTGDTDPDVPSDPFGENPNGNSGEDTDDTNTDGGTGTDGQNGGETE